MFGTLLDVSISSSTALEIGGSKWSYDALHRAAESVNSKFSDHKLIAILAHREVEAYAGILAVYNSGRTYVPISPKEPPARVAKKLAAIGCTAIISSSRHAEREKEIQKHSDQPLHFIDFERGEERPQTEYNEEHAYIMFTSGTTGEPKPVPVKRSSLEHYVNTVNSLFDFNSDDRFTQFFDLSFDLSVHDLFVCWSNGASLCVPDTDDVFKWPAFIREVQPTVWFSVPSVIRAFNRLRILQENAFPSMRLSLFCGEALYWSDVQPWKNATGEAQVANLYGPTECTIAVGAYLLGEFDGDGVVPIGGPFDGHAFDILDMESHPSLVSTALDQIQVTKGELIISGPQVFDGYLGFEREQQPFIQKDGKHWYCSGDLVSKDENGVFHFHGRIDDQVKIHGHRVELGEIDTALNALLDGRAVSILCEGPGAAKIISFVEGKIPDGLMAKCAEKLPAFMVPERFVAIESFPLNSNGKVDKKQLIELLDNV